MRAGEYATLNLKGLLAVDYLGGETNHFLEPSPITEVYQDDDNEYQLRARLHGLWFNDDQVVIFQKEKHPELYL